MSERTPSRIEEARLRAGTVKRTIAVVSAAAFVAALLLARASHPGAAATSTGGNVGAAGVETDGGGFSLDLGSGSIGSSGGSLAQVQTGVS